MPRVTFNGEGYHNASDEELAGLLEAGWTVITEKEFQEVLHAKRKAAMPEPSKAPVVRQLKFNQGGK